MPGNRRIMPGGLAGVTGPTADQLPGPRPAEEVGELPAPRLPDRPRRAEPGMSEFAGKQASKNGTRRTLAHVDLIERLPEPELDLVPISTRVPRELRQWLDLRAKVTRRPQHSLLADALRLLVANLDDDETLSAIRTEIYGGETR